MHEELWKTDIKRVAHLCDVIEETELSDLELGSAATAVDSR